MEDGTLDPDLDTPYVAWVIVLMFFFLIYMQACEEDWLMSRGEDAASVLMKPFLASLAPRP